MAKKFKLDINKVLGLGGGAIAAKVANKPLANLDPKLRAAAKVAAGIALPMLSKNSLIQNVGDGMIAVGVGEIAGSFVPALAGDEDFETLGAVQYDYMDTDELVDDEVIEGLADEGEPTLE